MVELWLVVWGAFWNMRWLDIVEHRRRDLLSIAPMTVLAAAGAAAWLGPITSLVWLTAATTLIIANRILCRIVAARGAESPSLETGLAAFTLGYTSSTPLYRQH
jgi:hypothetical protein